jgi:KDO2-lipid IV(A) lauroyltransferase
VESIKAFTISEEEANRRMTFTNTNVFDLLAKKGKSVIMVGGHYGNWELFAITIDKQMPHQSIALYKPLKSKFWDNIMKASRSRFGLQLHGIKEVKSIFKDHNNRLTLTIFGSDQSPRNPEGAYWTRFLNQDTGIQYGAEKYATTYNYAVVFGAITKKKRGYYNTDISLLFEESDALEYGAIMEAYSRKLEDQITADPPYYLWTHRRWKHKKPEKTAK